MASAAIALLVAAALDRAALPPSADVARGSEDAFASGLHPRELPPREAPRRWMGERARFRFRQLPAGPAELEVALHGQRSPVAVAADGVLLGRLDPGTGVASFALPPRASGALLVELRAEPFVAADGRRLGAQLDRVTLRHAPGTFPAPGVLLAFALPAAVVGLLARLSGLGIPAAVVAGAIASLVQALGLWPCGMLRSPYLWLLGRQLALGAAFAAAVAAWARRREAAAGPAAFLSLLLAVVVQWVFASAPLMVVSDAVFHANKLKAVAAGELFPISFTQHAQPFRIPYGAAFYALLAPFARAGADPVALVRSGASLSALLASAGLFALLLRQRGAAVAGLAVALLQLLPGVFDVYSFGNLSNVFGQAATTLFFAWWAGAAAGGALAGAALLALGGIGHLSSLIVLTAVGAALVLARRGELGANRARLAALGLGLALCALYYAHHAGLVLEQLPRLLEGGGQGRGVSRSASGAALLQLAGALGQWGLPAIALAALGLPRPRRSAWERDLAAYAVACLALFVPAVASPLDVRYLYALTLPLAVAAGEGVVRLRSRGRAGTLLALALLAAQAALAASGIAEAVLHRYRP